MRDKAETAKEEAAAAAAAEAEREKEQARKEAAARAKAKVASDEDGGGGGEGDEEAKGEEGGGKEEEGGEGEEDDEGGDADSIGPEIRYAGRACVGGQGGWADVVPWAGTRWTHEAIACRKRTLCRASMACNRHAAMWRCCRGTTTLRPWCRCVSLVASCAPSRRTKRRWMPWSGCCHEWACRRCTDASSSKTSSSSPSVRRHALMQRRTGGPPAHARGTRPHRRSVHCRSDCGVQLRRRCRRHAAVRRPRRGTGLGGVHRTVGVHADCRRGATDVCEQVYDAGSRADRHG